MTSQGRRRHAVVALLTAVLTGGLLSVLAPPASAAVSCPSPQWKAQYYANASFSGTPKLTTCDSAVYENYGSGDPAGVSLPKDNFSVRWTMTRDFGSGGSFRFYAGGQDGIRVYLDGNRKLSLWHDVSASRYKLVKLVVPSGKHTIRVDFVAWTGNASVSFAYAPNTGVDTVEPLAPTGHFVWWDEASGQAKMNWARNKEMDLAGYRVYRRPAGSSSWTKVSGDALLTNPWFKESLPPDGRRWGYEVRAVDEKGNESAGSIDRPVTTTDSTPPAAPTGLTAADSTDGVLLTWNPVGDAAGYAVYRRSGGEGTYTRAGTAGSASWTDTAAAGGTRHSYRVAALDAAGNESAPTASVEVARGDHAPLPPTGLTVAQPEPDSLLVELKWTASPSTDVSHYNVYLSSTSPVVTEGRDPWLTVYRPDEPITSPATFTGIDNRMKDYGGTYHYVVTAVDSAGNESAPTAEVSATMPGDLDPPGLVPGLTATAQADGVLLEWEPLTEPDLRRYDLYRGEWVGEGEIGDEENGFWSFSHIAYIAETDTSYLHRTTADGETVRYAVVGVDDWGNSRVEWDMPVSVVEVTELGSPAP
ncbi:PA14 domain-containing protein [Streptomyces aidingensis]|uniref:Fibronectin type 3 domain-containing protein n=1 Tax=Streptomyces aidingensis TaxID=910347 RepID=A0A1I1PZK7_9ACTN|nr:PA14 domain-containing protein [Streptomyces aidingensis]SFD15175.1 fibronectin type 3 domain-containing protein [Streptomyces aidingensis]